MAIMLESLGDLTSWDTYRTFMKERLKQLPDGECPFYLSKKKVDFDFGGKPWKGYAVLIGPKGVLAVKKIRKEGVQFHEGICRPNGKEFEVEGVPPNLLKFAHLTLKKMRLGYSIAGVVEGDEGEGEGEGGEQPGEGDRARPAARRAPLERAPEVWRMTRRLVKSNIDQLKGAVRKAFADEGKDLVAEIERNMKTLDEVFETLDDDLGVLLTRASEAPDQASRNAELKQAKALLASHIKYVKSEPLIAHIDSNPFGVQTNLQATLTKSLKHVVQTIGESGG